MALEAGGHVIANDLEIKHLKLIQQNLPLYNGNKIDFLNARMPQDLEFVEGSLDGVLISKVLHFMTPEEVMESLNKIFYWLAPGGKIFFVASTPFIKILEPFISVYYERIEKGILWAGFIEEVDKYLCKSVQTMPKTINLMDKKIVRRIFQKAGFRIKTLRYFAAECPKEWLYDGREFIGCIAQK